jgi:signal transduction histidine kinase
MPEAPRECVELHASSDRCIRDLIALSTLPAVWLGAAPARIAESLLAALDTTVEQAFGYIYLNLKSEADSIAVAHLESMVVPQEIVDDAGQIIRSWVRGHDPSELLLFADLGPLNGLRVVVQPLGFDAEYGVLAAGFSSGEPTQFQRILLNIAANQATIACRNAILLHQHARLHEQAMTELDQRHRAEARLRELARELEAKVRQRTADLEGFVYSIAHDMRQHIRSISVNAQMVLEDTGDMLPPESVGDLKRLVASAQQMNDLSDAILAHARMGMAELTKVEVCLSEIVQELWEEIRHRPYCNPLTKIVIEPGLADLADPSMMRLALENLLDNACKFSATIDEPVVVFGRDRKSYFVKDNGVGFDPKYAGKIFEPFERLDLRFAGCGVGLANVKRIIARHGGTVWAESAAGHGTTVRFSLSEEHNVEPHAGEDLSPCA